ncbi:hypothetical protein LIER_43169 [Lithospermum erythrorhizon]|uniref:Uncharacterized protein n=1 Tax=Lithospermum erythrorhizon TaxID=34254 RepID=A0AAV3PMJ6_LITER
MNDYVSGCLIVALIILIGAIGSYLIWRCLCFEGESSTPNEATNSMSTESTTEATVSPAGNNGEGEIRREQV